MNMVHRTSRKPIIFRKSVALLPGQSEMMVTEAKDMELLERCLFAILAPPLPSFTFINIFDYCWLARHNGHEIFVHGPIRIYRNGFRAELDTNESE